MRSLLDTTTAADQEILVVVVVVVVVVAHHGGTSVVLPIGKASRLMNRSVSLVNHEKRGNVLGGGGHGSVVDERRIARWRTAVQ